MKTPKQIMLEHLEMFGKMFNLPAPDATYLETIQQALHVKGWKISEFLAVLNALTTDDKYAESARFGKYPMLYDYLRIKKRIDSKDFYDSLAAYLSGCWWEKETVLALATPEQSNALIAAGGLSNLYQRASGDMPTAVTKLVDIVAEHEEESPSQTIDTSHRIGKTEPLKQIILKK